MDAVGGVIPPSDGRDPILTRVGPCELLVPVRDVLANPKTRELLKELNRGRRP